MLFNSEGLIQKYASPEDILREFYDLRLQYYAKRRAALLRVRTCTASRGRAGCWGRPFSCSLHKEGRGRQLCGR